MTTTLVLPTEIALEIEAATWLEVESAAILLARIAKTPNGDIRVLGRALRWVRDTGYLRREVDGLTIASEGYVHVLSEAETRGDTCIWLHTHPGENAVPRPSEHDAVVDRQLSDVFRIRTGSAYYGSLIFAPHRPKPTFTGYLQIDKDAPVAIDRLWCVGDRWHLVHSFDSGYRDVPEIFDRNVRALGRAIQETLGALKVTITGCGGVGSAVGEQLARLGVRHFLLVDPDILSASNLTRVYGSTPQQIGLEKVSVLAAHLAGIAPGVQCDTIASMVSLESTARQLTATDVIFGCTDDNAGRLVLSRLATFFLTPVIDCGVLISSDSSGQLTGIDGRVTTLVPAQGCLMCRDRIDLPRAAAELLTPAERKRRTDEGYAPALEQAEPAVVAYTTIVAAAAVGELLERLIGYGPTPRPSEILLRCHDRDISTNIASPRVGHYCHPSSNKLGLGVTKPFLEQVWPT